MKAWNFDEEAKLINMYEGKNLSLDVIAKRLGRSQKAISSRIYRLGLFRDPELPRSMKTGSRWTSEETILLQDLRANGWSMEKMARRLHRPVKAVDSKLHHAGLR